MHNRQAVPAHLGNYPKGALLIQLEDCDDSGISKPILHDSQFAYWNSKEWNVIDIGGTCSTQGKLANWIVVANGRKITSDHDRSN